jgi:hypothetical protein
VSLSKAPLRIASVPCGFLPRAKSRPHVLLLDPGRSYKRAAVRRLDVSESQNNLSDGDIR